MTGSERLVIENLYKTMGAVRALIDVSISVPTGNVHGIIGHNGSGKSTLVKILAGVLPPDEGSYKLVSGDEPQDPAGRLPRVATVFQDLGLADNLSVLDNLLVNSFRRNRFGYISIPRERSRAKAAMATVGLDLPLDVEAGKLPEPERVMLCVARAMMRAGVMLGDGLGSRESGIISADLLVMDEPTSSLPREELERFRDLVRRLRDETGVTMLIVTHNPSDISAFCDDFTALKNGRVVYTHPSQGVTPSMLAELMAGQSLVADQDASSETDDGAGKAGGGRRDKQAFAAENLMTANLSRPVTLSADQGELLGLTGLEGSGFREFIRAAMGIRDVTSGSVSVEGKPLSGGPPALRRADAVFIPADRTRTSGVPAATAYENMTMGRVDKFCRHGIINRKQEKSAVADMLQQFRVAPNDPRRILSQMSGGQQQKVVVGRAFLADAKLLVFEEPTIAVDVGARELILSYLQEAARQGKTVIVASGEFEWMPAVCDRIVVFRSGEVAGELRAADMGEEAILRLAYGD
jgi:ABC-type sugar transport system ATPase subunit